MIFSVIAKLQGKDKWPSALATVSEVKTLSEGYRGSYKKITFAYNDEKDSAETASLDVDQTTSLFNVQPGETFELRYNRNDPKRTYTDEAVNFGGDFRVVFWSCAAIFVFLTATITLYKKYMSH